MIFTGGFGENSLFSESSVAKNYAIENSIPTDKILIEEHSRITFENLIYAKEITEQYKLDLFNNHRGYHNNGMKKRKKVADAKTVLFKRLYGMKPVTFDKMLSILQKEYDTLRQKGGKPPKLAVKDKLSITLIYLREYRTMDSIAAEYGVCKGTVCLSVQWVEDTLTENGTFALPGKKILKRKPASIKHVVADVTESPVNRPKKDQKEYYSGKKTAHTEDSGHN